LFAPIYLVLDVLHVWAAQSLRGYEDTKIPLLLQVIAYWLIGFPLGYSLAITDFWGSSFGIYGFWVGLFTGISIGCVLMCARLYAKSRQFVVSLRNAT
jgi:MATE family multidrug resistance protein